MPINPWGGFQQGTNQLINILAARREEKERQEQNALRNKLLGRQVGLQEEEAQSKRQGEARALIGKLLPGVKDQASYTSARSFVLSQYPEMKAANIPEEYNPQYVENLSRAYGAKPAEWKPTTKEEALELKTAGPAGIKTTERFKSIGAGGLYDIESKETIPPAEKPTKDKWSSPQSGLDEEGKPVFFRTNQDNEVEILGKVTPEPKKGMKIYDREGNLIVDTGGGTASDISPRVKGELQVDIANSLVQLNRVRAVGESFSKDYLTWYGRAKGEGLRLMSFAGMDLSPEQKQFLQGKRVFLESVEQLFNIYRKDITGAQAVMKELTMLRESIINKKLAPDEFDASYKRFIDDGERALRIKLDLLEKGFSKENIGKEIDRIMKEEGRIGAPAPSKKKETNILEAMPEAEAREKFKSQGKTPGQIEESIKRLKKYGVIK